MYNQQLHDVDNIQNPKVVNRPQKRATKDIPVRSKMVLFPLLLLVAFVALRSCFDVKLPYAFPDAATTTAYQPSSVESFVVESSRSLGYDEETKEVDGCNLWINSSVTGKENANSLRMYRYELEEYTKRLQKFNGTVRDLRLFLGNGENNNHNSKDDDQNICDTLELHPQGLAGIFPSGLLSTFPGQYGFVEPLLPPLRHPEICYGRGRNWLMNMGYLIHDFAALCRNKLHRHSRTVFVDMGASLDFHGNQLSPAVYVTQTYQRFGFHFDHIYAYEVSPKDPKDVYHRVPDELRASYHWFNVGVDANIDSAENPLKLLLENFNEDDFIVVKLDVDTPTIEVPMIHLLSDDERLQKLVDVVYFEHHVFLKQLAPHWRGTMKGSMGDSLRLFTTLREKGISAHYWP